MIINCSKPVIIKAWPLDYCCNKDIQTLYIRMQVLKTNNFQHFIIVNTTQIKLLNYWKKFKTYIFTSNFNPFGLIRDMYLKSRIHHWNRLSYFPIAEIAPFTLDIYLLEIFRIAFSIFEHTYLHLYEWSEWNNCIY